MAVLDVLILLVTVLGFMYLQAPTILWTTTLGLILVLITLLGSLGAVALVICWCLFLPIAAVSLFKKMRRRYITGYFISALKQHIPSISNTEREAIEAGNVWWEKELFCGKPHWKKFLVMPKATLSKEEQEFIDNDVETLCTMLNDWKIVHEDKDLSKAAWDYLKEHRFFGLVIPKEYGGRGFSAYAHSTVVLKIATRSISAAVNTMVPNSLGPGELVLHYGTTEQKEYYLPRLASGQEIPCFALTGPEAGSDAGSLTDAGVVCRGQYQGKEVLGICLSWDKRYITLAPVATVLGLAFRLYDPDHLLGDKEDIGITLCLLPTSHPGVEIGNRHLPLHMAFMNGPTRGKDVFIPLDWMIGGVAMAGQGWRMLMECLSVGRSVSLPALSTACGLVSYRMTGAYARIRRQFNTSISNFEGVEEALGEIAGLTYLLESCRQLTCSAVDQQIKPAIVSAMAKYHMTEMARKVIANAMDIHAGHMIQVGPRNFLAHAHMSIPISVTVEGANILTRNLIIFGQGAIRCHPYLLQEVELLSKAPNAENEKQLDKLLFSHIGYAISNFARCFVSGLTGGYLLTSPVKGKLAYYYKQLTRMSIALSLLSDVAMLVLGGNLKRKERISARLGDMLSQLYLGSAALKYFSDHGSLEAEIPQVTWAVQTCLYHIQIACDELLHNFPVGWLGKAFRWIIFPWGTVYRRPCDNTYHEIVKQMLTPSRERDRLTQFCFIDKHPDDSMRRIEEALLMLADVDPIMKKMHKSVYAGGAMKQLGLTHRIEIALKSGVITPDEADKLSKFYVLQKEIIKVDEFTFDLNTVVT